MKFEKLIRDRNSERDENNIENLSLVSRKNLEKAMELELENAKFYRCAMSHAQNAEHKSIFQSLAKIEMEHIFLISKILKKPRSDINIQDICFRLDDENIKNSLELEKIAKEFYIKAYNQTTEPRIKEIFFGLLEAEGDHIELLKEKM